MKNTKIMGKLNVIDSFVVLVIIVACFGFYAVKTGMHKTSAQAIKREGTVEFDVYIRNQSVSTPKEIFPQGKKTFITIRNVPYTDLKIVKSDYYPYQIPFYVEKEGKVKSFDDVSSPYNYSFLVTLQDHAQITSDGAVIGGNKIKAGLKVELEGFKYRFPGFVTDVRVVEEKKS